MAEILLSSLISIVKEKVVNLVLQQFGAMWGIKEELEKLDRALLGIQFVLEDAEERQVKSEPVKKWLAALKNAAYDADDILDEFNYEAQRCMEKIQDNMANKVLDFFSLHNPVLFHLNMGKKLKDIIEKIDRIVAQGDRFKFREQAQPQPHTEVRTQTHSYVDESDVIGREEDKEKIVQLLLHQHDNKKVTVLPIFGMGGLGKTTLAQLVCGDQRIKEHFNEPIWICVSEEFDVAKLANSILASATRAEFNVEKLAKSILDSVAAAENNLSSMDLLQRSLREKLSGKRFLLVLDDVWNEDPEKWDEFKVLLGSGREGSAIMVTTRSGKVSEIMGTLTPYDLQYLSKHDSWTLFSNRAFKSRAEERPQLIEIGTRIVEKCGGLPLAVKALGSLMRTKKTEKEWRDVLTSEIWDAKVGEKDILPALRLSYNHLSPHLKQCFAFCSVFPKDYVMEKDTLIQLWIANGFIPYKGRMDLEITGQEIFDELVWRSFFQNLQKVKRYDARESGYAAITRCKMHDLIHDLAQSIMKSECTTSLEEQPHNIRHLFTEGPCQFDIDKILNKYPTIFTLLLPGTSLAIKNADLSKAKSLKVLGLQATNTIELPVKIRHLKHLRYLDLSRTRITEIPEAVCELFNLQTLKLSGCGRLCKLPEAMRNMRSLRHLYLHDCPNLKHMPGGMGQLSSLQTLTKYIVGDHAESGIRELKGLNLGGELELYNLEKVRGMEDAREASLCTKQNIESLALCWGVLAWDDFNVAEDQYFDEEAKLQAQNAENVLAALEPHSGLKKLVVWRYVGLHFPMWMMDGLLFQNMVEICLGYCKQCEHLPPLWQLPSLTLLHLQRMDSIKHLQSSGSKGTMQPFPSLKSLMLYNMQSLESWWGEEAVDTAPPCFHQLVWLGIWDCPNLTTMPVAPSLQILIIRGSNKIPLKSMLTLTTLSVLNIQISSASTSGETQLPSFSQESISFKHIKSLEFFGITGGEELRPLLEREDETRGFLLTLQNLSLRNCNWLFASHQLSMPPLTIWANLTSLRCLTIRECDALVFWPQKELQGLISLERLIILSCQNLTGTSLAPKSSAAAALEEGELAPHLEFLRIYDTLEEGYQCL